MPDDSMPHPREQPSAKHGGRAHPWARSQPTRAPLARGRETPWGRTAAQPKTTDRRSLFRRPLFLFLATVNLLSLLYFGVIASPIYVSRASLTVLNPSRDSLNLSSMLSGGASDGSTEAAYVLKDYVRSWQAFQDLSRPLNLAGAYSGGDIVSRYGGLLSLFTRNDVALWRYYRRDVRAKIDVKSGIVDLEVHAYRPDFARRLAQAVLGYGVQRLNLMGREQAQHDLAVAQARTAAIRAQLAQSDAALARYRARIGVYDPKEEYASGLNLLNQLGGKEADLRSQYAAVRKATPNSPEVKNLGDAVAAVEARIGAARARFPALGSLSAEYERLSGLRDNQEKLLQQASEVEQQAERAAAEGRYYMQVISPPSRPETPELPNRALWIAGVFLATLLIWGLLR